MTKTLFKPVSQGLAHNLSGGPIQHTDVGEEYSGGILVRDVSTGGSNGDGTIPNAEETVQNIFPEGKIWVADVSEVTIHLVFGLGSLTSALLKIQFSEDGTNWYQQVLFSETVASPKISYSPLDLEFSLLVLNSTIKFPIPPCKFMRFRTSSVGTITNSTLKIVILRGYGFGQWDFGPPRDW